MNKEPMFEVQPDYTVPLLRLLAQLPGGQGKTQDVLRLFESEYRRRIPSSHLPLRRDGNPIWNNNVRWCRNALREYGFLDGSVRGVWRITEDGRHWLRENPNAARIEGVPKRKAESPPRSRRTRRGRSSRASPVQGVTIEMLAQTRKLMPPDQFREVWGRLNDQLMAEERGKAVTEITQTELGRRTQRWLDEVHTFLSGKNATPPILGSALRLDPLLLYPGTLSRSCRPAALRPGGGSGHGDVQTGQAHIRCVPQQVDLLMNASQTTRVPPRGLVQPTQCRCRRERGADREPEDVRKHNRL